MTAPDPHAQPTEVFETDPDSVFVIGGSELTDDDMRKIFGLVTQLKAQNEVVFVLFDGRKTQSITPGARKVLAEQKSSEWHTRVRVAFGFSFAMSVVANMILRAQKLLSRKEMHVHFFEREEEARAFFLAERERVRQLVREGKWS